MISLLRPMRDADKPVDDPEAKGRTFARVHSTFAVKGAAVNVAATHKHSGHSGGCACGNPHGPCNA